MGDVSVIGVDLAKSVFQVHGIDGRGQVVLRQRLSRGSCYRFASLPRCLVGMETCASANYWARRLSALGHEVRLMPPRYVKPYVKRSRNDAWDAEAICEAVTRPTMRFAGVKSPERQSMLVLHRTQLILARQQTQLGNVMRAHLAEFRIIAPVRRQGLDRLMAMIGDQSDDQLAQPARACLTMFVDRSRLVLAHLLEPTRRSAPTAVRPNAAAGCKRSPVSVHSSRARSSRPCPIRTCRVRPQLVSLARAGPTTTLVGRQGAARRHYQGR